VAGGVLQRRYKFETAERDERKGRTQGRKRTRWRATRRGSGEREIDEYSYGRYDLLSR